MKYTDEAIVLAVQNFADADKIVTFLTKEHGKVKAMAYGSRRPRNPLAGGMQMFRYLEVELLEGRQMATVKQYALKEAFVFLGEDITSMAYASFLAEVALELCPEHMSQPGIFNHLLQIFPAFSARKPRLVALMGAYQLLEHSGSQMTFSRCALCGIAVQAPAVFSRERGGVLCRDCSHGSERPEDEISASLQQLIESMRIFGWKEKNAMVFKGNDVLQAERLLLGYLEYLFEKPLRSLDFIRQLSAT